MKETSVSDDGSRQSSVINVKQIDVDAMTGIEYEEIVHSIQFKGMILVILNDKKYINEAAIKKGPPLIYTKQEDEEATRELNKGFFFPTPKIVPTRKPDIAPICIVKIEYIGGVLLDTPLLCLFDSRSTGTLVNRQCLPPGAFLHQSAEKVVTTMANGTFDTSKTVHLDHIQFPEFVNGRVCKGVGDARLFYSKE